MRVCLLPPAALWMFVVPLVVRTAAAVSVQRHVSGWTAFHSCGNALCANMSRQLDQILRHSKVLDTVMPYTGGAAPQYNGVAHSACYYNGTKRIPTTGTWSAFRFGTGGAMPIHICAPFPDSLVSAWVDPLRRAGVASMPVLQGNPGTRFPKAGTDEGFFTTAVALALKFGLDGWSLDVEDSSQGEARLLEYGQFLTTLAARLRAAGLRLSTAEPNGYINTTRAGRPGPWGRYVGNFSGYAPVGRSGAEVLTMNTYYGVQPLTVKGMLPAVLTSWKTAVPTTSLLGVGFGAMYAAWGSKDCAMTPGDKLFNVSGINQTCTLKLSLGDVVAAGVSSVAIFSLNAFGCGTHYRFPMCQLPPNQEWPPESWWSLLHGFRHASQL